MVATIFALVLIALLVAGVWFVVDRAGVRDPFNWIIKGASGLLGLYLAYLQILPHLA